MQRKLSFANIIEILSFIALMFLIFIMFVQVFARKFLPSIPIWSGEEMATLLLIWLANIGGALAASRDSHISMDYFVEKMSERNRLKVLTVVYFVICIFLVCIAVVSFQLAWGGRFSYTARLGLSMFWIQISIFFGMVTMLWFYAKHFVTTIMKIKGCK